MECVVVLYREEALSIEFVFVLCSAFEMHHKAGMPRREVVVGKQR